MPIRSLQSPLDLGGKGQDSNVATFVHLAVTDISKTDQTTTTGYSYEFTNQLSSEHSFAFSPKGNIDFKNVSEDVDGF